MQSPRSYRCSIDIRLLFSPSKLPSLSSFFLHALHVTIVFTFRGSREREPLHTMNRKLEYLAHAEASRFGDVHYYSGSRVHCKICELNNIVSPFFHHCTLNGRLSIAECSFELNCFRIREIVKVWRRMEPRRTRSNSGSQGGSSWGRNSLKPCNKTHTHHSRFHNFHASIQMEVNFNWTRVFAYLYIIYLSLRAAGQIEDTWLQYNVVVGAETIHKSKRFMFAQ